MPPRLAVPPDLRTPLGRMKAARCAAGLTWKRMGHRLGVKEATVKGYELGLRAIAYDQLQVWARNCHTSARWLLELEGVPPKGLDLIPHVKGDGTLHTPRERFAKYKGVHLT